jgi:hypothetical protein
MTQPQAREIPTGAIGEFVALIHAAAAPHIERLNMNPDQAVAYVMAIFDAMVDRLAEQRPDTHERVMQAFARDLAHQAEQRQAAAEITPAAPVTDEPCDYCTQLPTLINPDNGEILCRECARDQYASPRASLSRLTAGTLRRYRR